jgi:uncharacterized protein (UPF0262 family)
MASRERLIRVTLDERTVARRSPDIEQERKIAIFDLLEENHFAPIGDDRGPYALRLAIEDNRLILDIGDDGDEKITVFGLALSPFRRIVKDYWEICESYYEAIRSATPSRIEAIDMARRGLHNEGSDILRERLRGKIDIDDNTARRLFTLLCVLHLR